MRQGGVRVKRIWRKMLLCAVVTALAAVLSGCVMDSTVEDLFTLPQPQIEYKELSNTIAQLLSDGYEYASPTAGQNIQTVQMVDLDWDGRSEVVAFFRRSADEKPLKIMLFHLSGEVYERYATIESSGTAIERVEYRDMNGDGHRELVVGWKIGLGVQNVAVYDVIAGQKVLMQSNYSRYSIQEMDGDGVPSLMILRADAEGASVAEFYGWRSEAMTLVHRTALSVTMAELGSGSVVSGFLDENTPAVFITGINEEGMAVTDILACRENGTLTNAALSPVTGLSAVIQPYRRLSPQDLDGDGIIEIPAPVVSEVPAANSNGFVDWLHCDISGKVERVSTTYHSLSDGWYLTVPEEWRGSVAALENQSDPQESQTTFTVNDKAAAAVYTITGENRENRALRGNRIVLRRRTDTVYAGEVTEGTDLTADRLRDSFRLIVSSWTN